MERRKGWLTIVILESVALLSLVSMPAGAQTPSALGQTTPAPIEPRAGTWKTWVLASGAQLRLRPPPDQSATQGELRELHALKAQRDANALDQITYWDAGSPGYQWNEMAIDLLRKNNIGNIEGSRVMALLNVTLYDATIAAWDSKFTYNRLRPSEVDQSLDTVLPNPRSPAYPSEHGAVAGAASAVLTYLFPKDAPLFAAKAQEAGRSRLLAGVQYPSDVKAGLDLGRAVAALVIERAKTDGSDAKWTGPVPTGPGYWSGLDPIGLTAGLRKTWVLASASQLRPGPPPRYDSAQMATEFGELKNFRRTPATNRAAFFWQFGGRGVAFNIFYWSDQTHQKIFEYRLDANPPRAARVYALHSVGFYDSVSACFDAKYAYWGIRPFQLDSTVTTLFATPNHPSYPAAHGCLFRTPATVLGYLFPRHAEGFKGLSAESAESRLWAGIHFRSDITAGIALGQAVGEKVIEWAKADGSQ